LNADIVNYLTSVIGSGLNVSWPTFNASHLLPANISVGTPKQYFGAIVKEFDTRGNFGGVGGETVAVAPGIKTGFIWPTLGSNGRVNGSGLDTFA